MVSGIMFTLLLIGMFTLAFGIRTIKAESDQTTALPLVYVLVEESIYDDLMFHIDRYVSDIKRIGFNATVISSFSNEDSPEDVRALLANAYSQGLVGCLLVGEIPWALYEDTEVDYETFPIDLFYMDLDGNWTDTDGNGWYDQHTGDRAPEIWVGRLEASDMLESAVSLIQNYFDKNHAYRTGVLSLPNRALIYIDDDWTYWSNEMDHAVGLIYDNRTLVDEEITTNSTDYLERLNQNWSLVHVVVHGNARYHNFYTSGEKAGNVSYADIRSTDPHAFFFNLVSCRNAQYNVRDYIGGWYIFSNTYGVAAIASTEVGGMWFLDDFYSNFKQETLGVSLRKWLATRIAVEDSNPSFWYNWTWYYGTTILGDPTLSAKPDIVEPVIRDIAITNISPSRTIVFNNTSTSINVTVENQGSIIETFNVTAYANETVIETKEITLTSGASTTITFTWNTTGFAKGNYTIKAYATPVPGETDTIDNTLTDGVITITIPGDVDGDRDVDLYDVVKICSVYGSKIGEPGYQANYDINDDDKIDLYDAVIACSNYGQRY